MTLHDPRAMFVARTLGGLNNVKRFVVGALALGVALATDGASGQSPASTQTPAPDPTPSPTPGQTQIVTSTGIICGADEVSFDAISGPTEGANPARLYAMDQNYAYLSEAMTNCDSNALPGCAPIHRWLNERQRERIGNYGRSYVTSSELIQARRVAAHAVCQRLDAESAVDHAACNALIKEEAAVGHFATNLDLLGVIRASLPTATTEPHNRVALTNQGTKDLIEVIEDLKPVPLPKNPAGVSAYALLVLSRLDLSRRACAPGGGACPPVQRKAAAAYAAAEKLALVPWFYAHLPELPVSSSVPASLLKAIDALGAPRPDPVWPPEIEELTQVLPSAVGLLGSANVTAGSNAFIFSALRTVAAGTQLTFGSQPGVAYSLASPVSRGQPGVLTTPFSGPTGATDVVDNTVRLDVQALRKVFAQRQDELRRAQFDCSHARFYVAPSGGFVYQRSQTNNDICIDTSSVRTDRPFEVDVSEYPFSVSPTSGVHLPTPPLTSYALTVWAGERTRIPAFHHSLVRITVRGYPSGVSLRMLALSGSAAAPPSLEFTDLLRLQAQEEHVVNERDDTATRSADAEDALADALSGDKTYTEEAKALTDSLGKADQAYTTASQPGFTEFVSSAADHLKDVKTAISTVVSKFEKTDNHGAAATAAAVAQWKPDVPIDNTHKDYAELQKLHDQSQKVTSLPTSLHQQAIDVRSKVPQVTASKTSFSTLVSRICRISKELIPVVDEDVLLDDDGPGTYVIDYDWDSGFNRTTQRKLMDGDSVFVRVRHVRPGGSVSVTFNDKGAVQHSVSLIGAPPGTAAGGGSGGETLSNSSAPVTADSDPDQPLIQARSTQIMSLGRLEGPHRYDIVLCAQTGGAAGCDGDSPVAGPGSSSQKTGSESSPSSAATAPSSDPTSKPAVAGGSSTAETSGAAAARPASSAEPKSTGAPSERPVTRVIARNTLIVHSEGHLGVRMGLGADVAFGNVRDVAQSATGGQYYVRQRDAVGDFALPLLLTWYPSGRDSFEGPPPFSWGIGAGLDVLKIGTNPRLYAALSVDWYGLGLTLGPSLERVDSINAAAGTYLLSSAEGTLASIWHVGAFAAATTDFDIFTAVFRSYFSPTKLPSIGTEAKP